MVLIIVLGWGQIVFPILGVSGDVASQGNGTQRSEAGLCGCFYKLGVPFCGCLVNKSSTIRGVLFQGNVRPKASNQEYLSPAVLGDSGG